MSVNSAVTPGCSEDPDVKGTETASMSFIENLKQVAARIPM